MVTVNKYLFIAYHEFRPISAEEYTQLQTRTPQKRNRFDDNMEDKFSPHIPELAAWKENPEHVLIIKGKKYNQASDVDILSVPTTKCATIAWLGSAHEVQRPSNSKFVVVENVAYPVLTWTDIAGHSGHGKMSDLKFQRDGNTGIYLTSMSHENSNLVIAALAETINADRSRT